MDSTDYQARARAWLESDDDAETRAELEELIAGDPEELAARFGGRLQFGTAGLRGLLGAGPLRMNRVVVRQTSAGLADYVAENVAEARKRGVVIGYDGRRNSDVFATAAARVFLDRGFAVYLSESVCSTPVAAYAVLDLGAAAGVVVTASHNPPAYNGYKVYWGNGAQIIPPHDTGIAAAIEVAEVQASGLEIDLDEALASGRLRRFGDDVERRYRRDARELLCHRDAANAASITIAYTPLHGVGAGPLVRLLSEYGYDSVVVEPSQAEPDGNFPTVEFPNPEEPGATDRLFALARDVGADIALANDPDADRLAVAIRTGERGEYRQLSGDQVGALLADYLLTEGSTDGRRLVSTTVVSSQLLEAMATALEVDYCETLTGFKWIANAAIDAKATTGSRFVLGYEEALGYSVGELVRDKDGLTAALLVAEMCAVAKSRDHTIGDRLDRIYRRYGVYSTRQISMTRDGAEGAAEIAASMSEFRRKHPAEIGSHRVRRVIDLEHGTESLPPTNALIFRLEGDARVIMRPSGTEPKLKCYYEVREPVAERETVADAEARGRRSLDELADAHQALLA